MAKSNEGETGVESVRIGGKPLDQLHPRARVEALANSAAEDRKAQRKAILARYPLYKADALEAAVRAAHENIKQMQEVIAKEQATIAEFGMFARLCKQRDRELEAAGLDPR